MNALFALLRRDVARAYASGGVVLPVIFFLLVATLYPFAVGPDGPLLAKTGGGVLWVAALLAALLPIDQLIAPDLDSGVLDQLSIRGVSDEGLAATKIVAHWISFGPPLMLATLPAAALLRLDGDALRTLIVGLAFGTPGLAALSVMVASLTASLRSAGALAGLLMLPLAIPLLIFGAGSISADDTGAMKLLVAVSLFLCAIAPFAVGAAIRAGRD
jgi:heme exporter protein B